MISFQSRGCQWHTFSITLKIIPGEKKQAQPQESIKYFLTCIIFIYFISSVHLLCRFPITSIIGNKCVWELYPHLASFVSATGWPTCLKDCLRPWSRKPTRELSHGSSKPKGKPFSLSFFLIFPPHIKQAATAKTFMHMDFRVIKEWSTAKLFFSPS